MAAKPGPCLFPPPQPGTSARCLGRGVRGGGWTPPGRYLQNNKSAQVSLFRNGKEEPLEYLSFYNQNILTSGIHRSLLDNLRMELQTAAALNATAMARWPCLDPRRRLHPPPRLHLFRLYLFLLFPAFQKPHGSLHRAYLGCIYSMYVCMHVINNVTKH